MDEVTSKPTLEADVCVHIFSVSAAMVGVCLTVIGLTQIVLRTAEANTIADDILVVDAFLFMCSCLLSYWALRTRSTRRMQRIEQLADVIFATGLLVMVAVCAVITYAII